MLQIKKLNLTHKKDLRVILDDFNLASVDKGIHNKTTKYGLPTY